MEKINKKKETSSNNDDNSKNSTTSDKKSTTSDKKSTTTDKKSTTSDKKSTSSIKNDEKGNNDVSKPKLSVISRIINWITGKKKNDDDDEVQEVVVVSTKKAIVIDEEEEKRIKARREHQIKLKKVKKIKMIRKRAAIKIQSLIRMFLGRIHSKRVFKEIFVHADKYWLASSEAEYLHQLQVIANKKAKKQFVRQYVMDVINTSALFIMQTYASILIQRVWRGYYARCHLPKPPPPPPKYRKVFTRFDDAIFRRVWARSVFIPKVGWPGKASRVEYDMMEYKDKPPVGEKVGLDRVFKVIAAPRSHMEASILLNDEYSWVGLPYQLQTMKVYKVDTETTSRVALELKLASPLKVPVVNWAPEEYKSKFETDDEYLESIGWKKPKRSNKLKGVDLGTINRINYDRHFGRSASSVSIDDIDSYMNQGSLSYDDSNDYDDDYETKTLDAGSLRSTTSVRTGSIYHDRQTNTLRGSLKPNIGAPFPTSSTNVEHTGLPKRYPITSSKQKAEPRQSKVIKLGKSEPVVINSYWSQIKKRLSDRLYSNPDATITNMCDDYIQNDKKKIQVKLWPSKPKKHFKLRYTWVPQRLIQQGVRKIYEEDKASSYADAGMLEGSTISSVEEYDQVITDKMNENSEINIMGNQQSLWSTYDDDDKGDHLSIKPKEMMMKQSEDFKIYLHKQKYAPVAEVNDEVEDEMNRSLSSSKKKKDKGNNDELPARSKKKPPPPPIAIVKHDQHWL